LWLRPSAATGGSHQVIATEPVGQRLALAAPVNMADLGQALHLCLAKSTAQGQVTEEEVNSALKRWGVAAAVQAAEVVAQVQSFEAWCANRWPGSRMLAEVPIEAEGPNGTRIVGRIDCLLKTDAGWVLIDHKANPRGAAGDVELAACHGPQLAAYAQAIEAATGLPVVESWLFQPVAGRAVQLVEGVAA